MKKPIPFGKYYLLERINVGGMAEVFRAKAYGVEGFERLVAVKRILPNIAEDKEFIKMFIDEAKIAVQLNHANIAQIFDLGMVDGSYYIALEHVHGRDLRAIFDRCRNLGEPMPIAQAAFIVMKVCEGLDYAHNKRDQSGRDLNLVHRDVSPQNILTSFEGEVKLIDFGIAKAAGKGAKTQAGILKGKFGYMSPEQVRGLPIDRRSDIFSCGIMLYELLTGERLFVGESDFSTLEKVRNVEILPPSTYNRRIPDELERIVLKALAKDPDDRYQNSIDLHDELQAWVYTAGEFYSRKDLAAWMKRVFAKEIEDETAKLESYRRLRPPDARAASRPPSVPAERPRRSTLAMPSATRPPAPPPIPGNGRSNGANPAMAAAARPQNGSNQAPEGLEWDDDELETQIYDGPEGVEQPPAPAAAQNPPPASAHTPAPAPGMAAGAASQHEPDLSSLVQSARGWDAAQPGAARPNPPPNLASGSSNGPSPFAADAGVQQGPPPPAAESREPSAVARLVNMAEPVFDSAAADSAGPVIAPPRSRTGLVAAIIAAVVLLGGGGVAAMLLMGGDEGEAAADTTNTVAASGDDGDSADTGDDATDMGAAPEDTGLSEEVLAETGFDLYVDPPEDVKVELDGKRYDVRLPMQVRSIAPGEHVVEIEGPPGFFSKTQTVSVEAGEAPRVDIELDAIDITGRFTSTPPGADVILVSDGEREEIGETPVDHPLDPRKRYEVIFEKRGYVTQTKPIAITGRQVEPVEAVLERARRTVASRDRDDEPRPGADSDREPGGSGGGPAAAVTGRDTGPDAPKKDEPEDVAPKKPAGKGTLLLGSKPPCKIYIDGRNTGMMTPQRGIELSAGRHKVTLINNEHNIKETFTVNIERGKTVREVKDMTDRIQ